MFLPLSVQQHPVLKENPQLIKATLIIFLFTVILIIYNIRTKTSKNTSSISSCMASFDPIFFSQEYDLLESHKCPPYQVRTPQDTTGGFRTRLYAELQAWAYSVYLLPINGKKIVLKTLCVSPCDNMESIFPDYVELDKTDINYPTKDVHDLSFANDTFDLIVADQVWEHLRNPFLATCQVHSALKNNGIAIITTVAYNPIHGAPSDYFRFMPAGLAFIARPFKGGIKTCGAWGNAEAISERALYSEPNLKTSPVVKDAWTNEEGNPAVVWIVVQK